ncbi:DUF6346 domain-containing protein [Amycolatopsis sp. 195334CR]|uniref:DUF6346 domain-containing protein n=1 Tax=Amycolatopsis sp. 195334CR TaxID=2814588 RepID=UPI001A8F44C7|nr:DUF6346 domain-containing protein [Amycolatopsis sp. 195334CR]MBN6037503.1 hypothetical protein [Amycolatopsis sp. 195334CR]
MTNPTRRLVKALAWCLALVLGLLAWSTVARVTYGGDPVADRLGVATVTGCAEHGPIGPHGFGTSYTCQADVRWSDGETEHAEFPAGQLEPGERDVPVYLDTSESGRADTTLGRNDTAKYSAVRLPAVIGFGFLAVVLALAAAVSVYRVFRPEERAEAKEWPVTRAERKAIRIPRLQLLVAWLVAAVAYTVLATIPRYDAPRGEGSFTSPWPQIEQTLLVDPPATGVVIIGLILAVLVWVIFSSVRTDAARVRRYGAEFLARDQRKKPVAAERPKRGAAGLVIGLLLLAVAAWGTIRVISTGTAAPFPVWLASARDAVLFACLGALWLATAETSHQRIARLLAEHAGPRSGSGGTGGGTATS